MLRKRQVVAEAGKHPFVSATAPIRESHAPTLIAGRACVTRCNNSVRGPFAAIRALCSTF